MLQISQYFGRAAAKKNKQKEEKEFVKRNAFQTNRIK